MEWKKYANNGFWGALGAVAGYFYGDSKNKDRELRRKRRTILGGVSLLTGTIMLFSTGIKDCSGLVSKHFEYNHKEKMQQLDIEKEKVAKGYVTSIDDVKKDFSSLKSDYENRHSTLEGKIHNMVDDINSEMLSIEKDQSALKSEILTGQKELNNKLADVTKDILDKKNSPPDYNSLNTSNPSNSTASNTSSNNSDWSNNYAAKSHNVDMHIIADKSDQKLTLWDNSGNKLYECDMIYSKSGGPANGTYPIKSIEARSGDLYPGVTKMTDVIVITGSGTGNRFDNYIDNKMNVNKTGIRTYNDEYRQMSSIIEGKKTDVLVRD